MFKKIFNANSLLHSIIGRIKQTYKKHIQCTVQAFYIKDLHRALDV